MVSIFLHLIARTLFEIEILVGGKVRELYQFYRNSKNKRGQVVRIYTNPINIVARFTRYSMIVQQRVPKEREKEKIVFPIKIYSLLVSVGILLTRWGQSFAGMFDAFNVFANCDQKLRLLSTTIKF